MKYIVTLLVSLFFYNTRAQLPDIQGNIAYNDKNPSVPFQYLKRNNYEFAISYHIYSGWKINNDIHYNLIAFKKNTWRKLTIIYDGDLKNIKKLEAKKVKKQNAENLITMLTQNGFWSLNPDSLSIKAMPPKTIAKNEVRDDTVHIRANITRSFRVVDGSTDIFEIFDGTNVRSYTCESAELYQQRFPEIKSTLQFIKSKKAFTEFLKNN